MAHPIDLDDEAPAPPAPAPPVSAPSVLVPPVPAPTAPVPELPNTSRLDNAVWAALDGPHAHLAERAGRAARYPADVYDFAALAIRPIRGDLQGPARATEPLTCVGAWWSSLDDDPATARARRDRLDTLAGYPYIPDAPVFTGTPHELADLLQELNSTGLSGFRLRPAVLGHDLPRITQGLVPELQRRGAFRRTYEASTLRGLLGLERPVSRYAAAATA
ncbi:hypothetical protein SHIRM173S_13116 [Streptomyces hirsutus]